MTNPIDIAAGLRGALGSPGDGLTLSGQTGTIAAVGAHGANTVDVYLDNSASGAQASVTPSLPYMSDYNPAVGDAVFIVAGQAGQRTSRIVLGTLAGSSSGPGSSGVPVGTILMFPVTVSYPNFLLCNGSTFSAATYPLLNTLLGGNTLPDMRNVLPMGAGATVALGANAGSSTVTIAVGQMPSHSHTQGTHSHTQPAHNHTQPAHNHTEVAHNHTQTSHAHSPNGQYFVQSGAGDKGSAFITVTSNGYSLGSVTSSVAPVIANATPTINNATPTINNATPGVDPASAGAIGNSGSGSSLSVLNPVLGVAYYIRAA